MPALTSESESSAIRERRNQVILHAARAALKLPLLPSGLWFHGDWRDNFYYALHLYIAAASGGEIGSGALADKPAAKAFAERMLLRLLRLQQRDPGKELYGHWPLGLGNDPEQARPHPLPAELVGNLTALLAVSYKASWTDALAAELHESLNHLYLSRFYADAVPPS